MRYLKTKARKLYKVILEWELMRGLLKYIINNLSLPFWCRQYALLNLSLLPLHSSIVFLKHRCFFSNQSRSISSFFKLNRMRFKLLVSSGKLSGVQKSSW